jgi:abortive infection bacteriophage resistance protein
VCKECGNEFYGDLHDYNIDTANTELRKFYGTILVSEIEEIVKKYNVEAEELSLILRLEKGTISKYLDGMSPKKEHSELLKKIKDDSELFQSYLDKYKNSNMKV